MSFVPSAVLDSLGSMDRSTADGHNFGIVQLDDAGMVTLYNTWEAELTGLPPSAAEGKNFFTQVAPCTNNRLVHGKFKDGLVRGELDSEFNYTFTYRMKPTNVMLRLLHHKDTKTNWIFIATKAA